MPPSLDLCLAAARELYVSKARSSSPIDSPRPGAPHMGRGAACANGMPPSRLARPSAVATRRFAAAALLGSIALSLVSCSGGGSDGRGDQTALGASESADFDCDGSCPSQALSAEDVARIVQQGVQAAGQLGVAGTLAVVDRVGNVLAVYQMPGAPATTTIGARMGSTGGLEGAAVPATFAAISKAGTGAFLSSQGNAFSTRTASQIIQENFDPGEEKQPGGPLFGVQFSQLICSDINQIDPGLAGGLPTGAKPLAGGLVGPRPLPLALSGDPGGFPLYKAGDMVGGIGVEIDGIYSIDRDITDLERDNIEEIVALSASRGFVAPAARTANNMFVAGRALRYSDVALDDLPVLSDPLPALDPSGLVSVPIFFNGSIRGGSTFGSAESGVQTISRAGIPAMTLVDAGGNVRFPSQDGAPLPGGIELKASEVEAMLDGALATANRSRAAIRRPLDASVRVSVFVIDTNGRPIGFTRSQDAPVFGIDVSIQKARASLLFSSPDLSSVLNAIRAGNSVGQMEDYAGALASFVGPDFAAGRFAVSARAVGNLSRPFYPDGINHGPNGPLSLPFPPNLSPTGRSFSPFNNGLQLDLVFQRLVAPLGIPNGPQIPDHCVDERFGDRLRNGIQIFSGGVPLYRNGALVGAIGISGDGIFQDDMVAFLGVSRPGLDFVGRTDVGDPDLGFNAPREIRSDRVEPQAAPGTRLRYVNCPEAPFIDSNDQNACEGL